jgi:pectate lyase
MISIRKTTLLALFSLLVISASQAQSGNGKGHIDRNPQDVARQTLDPTDGWAAFGGTTTGGSAADANHVFYVHNRQELVAALNKLDATPKIIFVIGTIDADVDDNNQPLTCVDYQRNGYTLEGYLATYDPAVWGRTQVPSGPMEQARVASQQAQQARVRIRVASNTTILGMDKYAIIRGAWFDVRNTGTTNIIIRNLTFQDTYDCFPQWDPTDGSLGNWNSQYDSISIRNATHVWVDHNRFEDLTTSDSFAPFYFGRIYQQHDGELDITNAADLVTVSWNRFLNHDKVSLIGSSDSGSTANGDRGKLRVTFHHNYYEGTGQRTPRVRFGKVHVYNNMYRIVDNPSFQYAWGVGIESAIYAENNFFRTDDTVTPDQFISVFKGTAIHATGTLVNGNNNKNLVDVVAAYNAANDPDLGTDVGWTPTLVYNLEDTRDFWPMVQAHAGPFDLQDK